ncbi:Regulator of ATP-sensitive K channels Alpha-endosulfine/ARPP-19 and related cAMP-regulated phosphoproteins [Phaffia rhodozyma]|uniref:mRNA stability protein n=1 Tax=Phaffia rhodozyma TaxID=264483 RepID=A0A0F7SQE7_PHARH|nr:Regulator of ATP-sensitive K channels Alpha-endosulfine/ARPP-19 and related cAMP-regulated phosphoproteins [Phaffia rhodozyma]
MIPAQKNKVDLSTLNEEEKKLFQLYGKLPSKKSNPLSRMQERKYFDSGDYAMSKAGTMAGNPVQVGTAIPKPETIPHASPPPSSGSVPTLSSSPSKDSSMGSMGSIFEGQHTRRLSSSLSNV